MYSLAYIFFIFLLNKFHMCIDFYYKLILVNKFIKHNQVNNLFFLLLKKGFLSVLS